MLLIEAGLKRVIDEMSELKCQCYICTGKYKNMNAYKDLSTI